MIKRLTQLIKIPVKIPVVPAIFFFTLPQVADLHYLETVGVILPMIVAALVAASTAIVIYWRKVRAFFGNLFRKGKGIEKDNEAGED